MLDKPAFPRPAVFTPRRCKAVSGTVVPTPTFPALAIVTRLVFAPFRNSNLSPPVDELPPARTVNLFSLLPLAGRNTYDAEAVEPVDFRVSVAEAEAMVRIEPDTRDV